MCGICGSTRDPDGSSVAAMKALLLHRGPDDEGIYQDEGTGLTLGVRRLSVIDVAGGHQPVSNEDGTVWAMLNGEIYNHPSLRSEEHTSELQSLTKLVCRLLLEKKKQKNLPTRIT